MITFSDGTKTIKLETIEATELLKISIQDYNDIIYTYSIDNDINIPIDNIEIRNEIISIAKVYSKMYNFINKLMAKRNDIYKLALFIIKHIDFQESITMIIKKSNISININNDKIIIKKDKIRLDGFDAIKDIIVDDDLLQWSLRAYESRIPIILAAIKYLQKQGYLS